MADLDLNRLRALTSAAARHVANNAATPLTRRDVLKLGAVAAIAGPAALQASPRSDFIVDGDERRLVFSVDGIPRWIIDPSRFDGTPELKIRTRTERRIRFSLRNARYPGTKLPADFDCFIERKRIGTLMRMRLALANGEARATFVDWLLGEASLEAAAAARSIRSWSETSDHISFAGQPRVSFNPDWSIDVRGHGAIASADGIPLRGARTRIQLEGSDRRATIVTMWRGGEEWDFGLWRWSEQTRWGFSRDREAFHRLHIELEGDDAVFRAHSAPAALRFKTGGTLRGADANPLEFSLAAATFAMKLGTHARQRALIASLGSESQHVAGDGFAFDLFDDDTPALEITCNESKKTTIKCEPCVKNVAVAMPDIVVANARVGDARHRIDIFWESLDDAVRGIHIGDEKNKSHCVLPVELNVLRPSDLLVITFRFVNVVLTTRHDEPCLEPVASPALLIAELPPQSIAEKAYLKTTDIGLPPNETAGEPLPEDRVPARLAEPSRLAFELDHAIDFTVESLLAWSTLKPHVADTATPPGVRGPATPHVPGDDETAIEAPYRLVISPDAGERFDNATKPATHGRETELWHTRLERFGDPSKKSIRAIWSPDMPTPKADGSIECLTHFDAACPDSAQSRPFRMSLDRRDRFEIVRLSADPSLFDLDKMEPYAPKAINTQLLMLSSLGAWLDVNGEWDPFITVDGNGAGGVSNDICKPVDIPKGCASTASCTLTVENWRHRATMARDNFVRVVYAGFLMPFGHRTVLIKETERKIEAVPGKKTAQGAYLRQRFYLLVRQPVVTYNPSKMQHSGRGIPLTSVRIDTLVTPDLDAFGGRDVSPVRHGLQSFFWPMVARKPFEFHMTAFDVANPAHELHFSMPLLWGDISVIYNGADEAITAYNDDTNAPLRVAVLGGQKVAFAGTRKEGDTTLDTNELRFRAQRTVEQDCVKLRIERRATFDPLLASAAVRMPAVERLTGEETPAEIKYPDAYIQHGFEGTAPPTAAAAGTPSGNSGEVFAELVNEVKREFPGAKSGGLATPDLNITSVSRLAGPVAGQLDTFTKGVFDPLQFFDDPSVMRLLGVIGLKDVIQPVLEVRDQLTRIPKLILDEAHAIDKAVAAALTTALVAVRQIIDDLNQRTNALRQTMRTLCEHTVTEAEGVANDVQAKLVSAIGHEFEVELTTTPIHVASPCSQIAVAAAEFPPSSMISAGGAALIAALPNGRRTFAAVKTSYDDMARRLAAAPDALESDFVALQNAFDITGPVQKALTQFRRDVEEALRSIAAAPQLPVFAAIDDVIGGISAVASAATSGDNELFDLVARLITALKRLRAEAEILASTGLGQFPPIADMKRRVATAKSHLEQARDQLKTDLTNAVQNAKDNVNATIAQLSTSARNDLQTIAAALSTEVADAQNAIEQQITAAVLNALDPAIQLYAQFDQAYTQIQATADALRGLFESVRSEIERRIREEIASLLQPRDLTASYAFAPQLRSAPASAPIFIVRSDTSMTISTTVTTHIQPAELDGSKVEMLTTAELKNFDIRLFPFAEFLKIHFSRVSIVARGFTTPDVQIDLNPTNPVEFGGALKFVQSLQDKLPFGKNGLQIGASSEAITVGYRFALPNITMGALNLRSISITAGLELPFRKGPARIRFAFAERNRPFILTIGILGGGGFIAVTLGVDRVERLEGALEFGATAELSLGPAHGEAHILAGIYFSIEPAGARLSGYLRAGGSLDILDLVTMCVEFYLGFTHDEAANKAFGEATVDVSIEIGPFFEVHVSLRCRREFKGGDSPNQQAAIRAPNPPALAAAAEMLPMFSSGTQSCGGSNAPPEVLAAYRDHSFKSYRTAFVTNCSEVCHG